MPGLPILDVKDVQLNAELFRLPRIIAFNRLESRPRTTDFTRSLSAEVRDPLWLLCRQWQFGEFLGEDAASPLSARIAYRHHSTPMLSLRDAPAFPYDPATMPLETHVERETVTLGRTADGKQYNDVMYATRWGNKLLRMLTAAGLDQHYPRYIEHFTIAVPSADGAKNPVDTEAQVMLTTVGRRVADGVAVWRAAQSSAHAVWLATWAGAAADPLQKLVGTFAAEVSQSFERLFTQPASPKDSAWSPAHLDYQFAVETQAADQKTVPTLRADHYAGDHLDWFSFDAVMNRPLQEDPGTAPPPAEAGAPEAGSDMVESFLPAPVRFKGQPQPRFWAMEESQTDFGKIETSTTGLLHLLLAEFGLVYSNDWFMLPHPMPVNTLCEVRGILVDDSFGRHTFVRAAGRDVETHWQQFGMFHLTEIGARPDAAGSLFYLPAAAGKVLESAPVERVNFIRDEMANMVWAVESIVPSQTGQGMRAYRPPPPSIDPVNRPRETDDVKIAYLAGTTVPANWTPFIPVHAENSVSEIRLQRARMAGSVPPLGRVLREPKSPYFVNEEEIPRTGILVTRTWQRARWMGGRTLLWIGRSKTAGRGEGGSNLSFDRIRELEPKT